MIVLYSDSKCHYSHMVRIVLYMKNMDFKIIDVNINLRQDLMLLNPYNETPVLVDDIDKNNKKNDLILTEPNIICEYIDERFPHPQFMPIEPSEKARIRMLLFNFDRELLCHLRFLENSIDNKDSKVKKECERVKAKVILGLESIADVFNYNRRAKYLFGNSFSLLDAAILPLLWRLNYFGIEIKKSWDLMINYANNIFEIPEFIASLTPAERGMRD